MAELEKCFTTQIAKSDSVVFLSYGGSRYLKMYDGTAVDTTFKLNGTGSDLTGVISFYTTARHPSTPMVTGTDPIIGNNGGLYYKMYLDVYNVDANGLVGATPTGRKGG